MNKFITQSIVALLSIAIGFGLAQYWQIKQDQKTLNPITNFENKLSKSIANLQQLTTTQQAEALKELTSLIQKEAQNLYEMHKKSRIAALLLIFQSPAVFISQESLHTTYAAFYEASQKFYNNL